jgi:hypothetical protein
LSITSSKGAADQVEEGNKDLHKAIHYLKKFQKKGLGYVCEMRCAIYVCGVPRDAGRYNMILLPLPHCYLCYTVIVVVIIIMVVAVAAPCSFHDWK